MTQDDNASKRRKHMAVMDDKRDLITRAEADAMVVVALRMAADECTPHDDDDSLDRQAKAECRDAILSLTPADAAAALDEVRKVKVKPLVWEERSVHGCWRAETTFGEYSVGFDDGWWAQLEGVEFWEWETPEDPRCYNGPEAGMLACKADYEARILAALEEPK